MQIIGTKKPKIAIVHEFLTYFGGAEQVLISLHKLYPESVIYTILYDENKMRKYFPKAQIRTSFANKLRKFFINKNEYLLPFMPVAAETFDLKDFDIIISSSNSFSKGIITKPRTIHICYCHSPTRFLWDWHFNYIKENKIKGFKKAIITPLLHYIRMWDKSASERVDYFIANSNATADRIRKFYRRESKVIYPPCGYEKFEIKNNDKNKNAEKEIGLKSNYFLIVSRLSPYKRIDLAVEAFNKLELPLVIIGEGKDKKKLKKIAKKNITFLGFQEEKVIREYYQNCFAFVFPGEDDFGITPVEAMSAGKPVLAYRKGGVLESVVEGVTGEFFDDQTPEVLADGIRRIKINYKNYNAEKIREYSKKFSREKFEMNIKKFIGNITK